LIALNRGLPLALARYESRLRGLEGANLEVASSLAYLNFGQAAILNAGVAAVTLLAAARCVEGSLTLGDVVLANQLLLGLAGPLNMLGMVYREYTSAVTDMAAALPVLDLVPAAPAAPAAPSAPAASAVRARAADGVASCDVQPAAHAMRALSAAAVREHGVRFEHVCFQYPSLPAEPKHAAAAAATAANAAAAAAPGTAGSAAAAAALGGARPAALRDISFHVPFGATVAIVGSSGSGKSTILRLATALARPSAGRVLVGGVDARELEPAALRGRVATVLQDSSSFFRESVGFNAGYALLAARARREALAADARGERLEDVGGGLSTLSAAERGAVRRAAERAQLDGVLAALPHGLETDAGERGSRLSGGERQRLGLARALTRVGTGADADDAGDDEERALVLLCDEPTSALDALTEARVLAELRASGRAACTIFVTHRLASCAHADEILVLRGGCVAERGTHAQLVALAGGEYARMWRTQMDERGELAPE
jgi:ABC-type multidrug transport system fused ATPase/permease subunit